MFVIKRYRYFIKTMFKISFVGWFWLDNRGGEWGKRWGKDIVSKEKNVSNRVEDGKYKIYVEVVNSLRDGVKGFLGVNF